MLYIWPFFAFFSAPLFIPSLISFLTTPFRLFRSHKASTTSSKPPNTTRRSAFINIPYALLTLLLSVAVVKFNTIIHPFTLADNRHYMFYIFRHTILRSPAIRLALVAVYTLCRWLAWDQLAGHTAPDTSAQLQPAAAPESSNVKPNNNDQQTPNKPHPEEEEDVPLALLDSPASGPASSTPPRTSTTLLWVLTTALSLITAPLVEPRYFILPWVFYRLLMPSWSWPQSWNSPRKSFPGAAAAAWLGGVGRKIDLRLVLETAWFLVVNGGTMYMFLWRPFYWGGEEGALLDGGRVQRFMW